MSPKQLGMGLDRRTFLQGTGLTFLSWAMSDRILRQATAYGNALANPTPRKLALLVGIDNYSSDPRLKGCATDTQLQRELLIHRFNFQPNDILVLTNEQATREAIETAFAEHLGQAKEGDVVLFHFSGYGSLVQFAPDLKSSPESETVQPRETNSLVPFDGQIPNKGKPVANDILADTLILLTRSLATQKCTLVLDTSFAPVTTPLQGNLRVRSCPLSPTKQPSPEELAFQDQLRLKQKISPSAKLPQWFQVPGVVLAATQEEEIALERQWQGFSAGVFTYALTQYLWEAFPANTLSFTLTRTSEQTRSKIAQQPQLIAHPKSGNGYKLGFPYFIPPLPVSGAEGVVQEVTEKGSTATVYLGGMPQNVWLHYENKSQFLLLSGEKSVLLELRSHNGLTGKVEGVVTENYSPNIQPGMLLQEQVRLLPRKLGLTVALDEQLQRIERVDATSALSNVSVVASIITAGEQQADCLFGKSQDHSTDETSSEGQEGSHYELFSLGGVAFPNTKGASDEAVKSAVHRLVPALKTRLAAKLWELTLNEGSSLLPVKATLEMIKPQTKVLTTRTTRGFDQQSDVPQLPQNTPSVGTVATPILVPVPVGGQLQYTVENASEQPLYVLIIGLDPLGNAIALYTPPIPHSSNNNDPTQLKDSPIPPQETLTLPRSSSRLNGFIAGSIGIAQMQLICSTAPFTKTLRKLATLPSPKGEGDRLVELPQPLDIAQLILEDLHQGSQVNPNQVNFSSEQYALDVHHWASFQLVFEVV